MKALLPDKRKLSHRAPHQRYQLNIAGVNSPLCVLNFSGQAQLSEPWHYEIGFTAPPGLSMAQVLTQPATFTLLTPEMQGAEKYSAALSAQLSAYGGEVDVLSGDNGFSHPQSSRRSGIVTAFSQTGESRDETRYQITLSPRLALLDNSHNSAIYQHQSVVSVVESVLRRHGFTGMDYRFELSERYPTREYLAQWQESDLTFIRRLLADSGIWFRFDPGSRQSGDVVVFGDSPAHYQRGPIAPYRPKSGQPAPDSDAITALTVKRKTVIDRVVTRNSNYRRAQSEMTSEVTQSGGETTTRGEHYYYGDPFLEKGPERHKRNSDENEGNHEEETQVGQGAWYARLHHQRALTEQITFHGNATLFHLWPGQTVTVLDAPITEACEGILITGINVSGSRRQAYRVAFTAVPYNVNRPWRPARLAQPVISGTIPARISSATEDGYGYLDEQGRYRVSLDVDRSTQWRKGEESAWLRLARGYAGDGCGLHFPLLAGTEVAIGFTQGNPDRPYIVAALHDSRHNDVVTAENHTRNRICTAADNQLQMEDERGKEHIALSTVHGQSALTLGHIVDEEREARGNGFELCSDEHGAIRAGKGVLISTEGQVTGQINDTRGAQVLLEQAQRQMAVLNNAAEQAQALLSDIETQQVLIEERLKAIKSQVILLSGTEGIGIVSGEHLQLSSSGNTYLTGGAHLNMGAGKGLTLNAGGGIGLFSQHNGIKAIAGEGEMNLQAQSGGVQVAGREDVEVISGEGRVIISAKEELILHCGGGYIRLGEGGVEVGCPNCVEMKAIALEKHSASALTMTNTLPALCESRQQYDSDCGTALIARG